jgi:peptide/nickel transport system permease protein
MAMTFPTPRRLGYRFNAVGVAALAVILFWAVVALIGPWLTPYPPGEIVDIDTDARREARRHIPQR